MNVYLLILVCYIYAGISSFMSWYDRRYYFGKPWWVASYHLFAFILLWWAFTPWVLGVNIWRYDIPVLRGWIRWGKGGPKN